LSSHIQTQFLNDVFHSGEVQTLAILEILSDSVTKSNPHWLIGSMEDAGFQVGYRGVAVDHSSAALQWLGTRQSCFSAPSLYF
jgi:hypothetical protein